MAKYVTALYEFECQIFRKINRNFEKRMLNKFFHLITHLGGAIITIASVIILILFTSGPLRLTAIASAVSLTISHIPVAIIKKFFPRKRPYLVLEKINVTSNPLEDHSFPSGHTTAIFSVIIPFIILLPFNALSAGLLLIAVLVGLSRIVLGLHYPSDVLVGCLLGSFTGYLTFTFIQTNFHYMFKL